MFWGGGSIVVDNKSSWKRALSDSNFQSDSYQSDKSEEKPVINEIIDSGSPVKDWEFSFKGSIQRGVYEEPPAAAEADEQPSINAVLKEGMRLFGMKHWEDALQELHNARVENLNDEEQAELTYYLGLCYTKLERYDDAPLYLEQVISSSGDPLRVYQCRMTLAYIYIMSNHAEMADAELEHLESGGLESAMLYNTMAYSAYAQKRYLGAIELYEKALEIDKDNLTALNSLGYILADMGLDKLKGLRLCRKAVDKDPQNAAYLDSLGWANYRCGKLTDARKWLRQAMDIASNEQVIRDHFRIVGGSL
jgi:tetratricopeptide (TPR) repeat protein